MHEEFGEDSVPEPEFGPAIELENLLDDGLVETQKAHFQLPIFQQMKKSAYRYL